MSSDIEKVVIRLSGHDEDHEDGAHGGAWKVAYADFMTALMAFFLLMWILSTTEEKKLEGLADYFTPTFQQSAGIGGDGALGGTAPDPKGILANRVKPLVAGRMDPEIAPDEPKANPWTDVHTSLETPPEDVTATPRPQPLYLPGYDSEPSFAERQNGLPGDRAERFEALEDVAERIEQALVTDPALERLAASLSVDLNADGLELQILDREDVPMFDLGKDHFSTDIASFIARLGATIRELPNPIVVTGHTDATPYNGDQSYTNWELSTDRAHATRRALIAAGVESARFSRVSGVADTDLLRPEDPTHPSNRRITVHLVLDPEATED